MNHKFTVVVLGVIFVFLLGACPAEGALVAYMKVGDIRGDVSAEGHEHWSEILSCDMSVQNDGWQPHREDPVVSLSDMYVTKYTDRASPYLLNGVWTGEHFPQAETDLVAVSDVPRIYLQWEFHDVGVSNYSTAFNGQSVELVALDFASVDYRYYPGE